MEVSSSRFFERRDEAPWPESMLNVNFLGHLDAYRVDSNALLNMSSVLDDDEVACLPCQTGFSLSRALKRFDESAEMEAAFCMNPALLYFREHRAIPSQASFESQQSLDSEDIETVLIQNETYSSEIQVSKQTVKLRNEDEGPGEDKKDEKHESPDLPAGNVESANKHAPITAYFWKYNAMSSSSKKRPPDSKSSLLPSSESGLSIYQLEESLHADNDDDESDKPDPENLYDLGVRFRHFSQLAKAADAQNSKAFRMSRPLPNDASGVIGASTSTVPASRKRKKGIYSSRIWRLKKKMRREANKLKLHALNQEHDQLIKCIFEARDLLRTSLNDWAKLEPGSRTMVDIFDELVNSRLGAKVSGRTDAFVFDLMQEVERKRRLAGEGGLLELNDETAAAPHQTTRT